MWPGPHTATSTDCGVNVVLRVIIILIGTYVAVNVGVLFGQFADKYVRAIMCTGLWMWLEVFRVSISIVLELPGSLVTSGEQKNVGF